MLVSSSIKLIFRNTNPSKRNASHVAFIGLGNMGSRMVNNLVKKGQSVKVFDVVESAAKSVTGVQVSKSPREAAEGASVVITMLPNGDIVKETVLGENGILASIPKNSVLVDSSTIDPKVAQELFTIANKNQVKFVDAPVSGGVVGAGDGTLTFMVGGNKEDIATIEPVLLCMGARVVHCGKVGAGQIAKICNNLILGATMMATAEGMNLGIKLGLDPNVLASIVNTSTGKSWSSDVYNPVPGIRSGVPSERDYEGGFSTNLIAKDLALAQNAAASCDAPIVLAATAHQIYRTMISNGLGQKDFSSVYKFFKGN